MDKKVWNWFFSSLRPFRAKVIQMLALAWVLGAISASLPILLQRIIDAAVAGQFDTGLVIFFAIGSALSVIPITHIIRNQLCDTYVYQLRGRVFAHLLRLDVGFHEDRGSDVVTTQAGKGIGACARLISLLGNGQLVVQVPVAVFALLYIGGHNPLVALLLVVFMIVFAVSGKRIGKKLAQVEEEYQDLDTKIGARTREAVQYVSTVRVSHADELEVGRYWREGKVALLLQYKVIWLYAKFLMLGNGGGAFASLLVVLCFVPYLVDGTLTAGTFFALFMYAGRAMQPASFLGEIYAEIQQAGAKIKLLVAILEAKPVVTEAKQALSLNPLRQGINLSGVTFCYQEKKVILNGINLFIPAGQKTAIVGKTGSGKTTLARLITRLYDPTAGIVEFDGTDVRHLSLVSLYREIAYLSQEVPIFSGTIAENVCLGVEGCSEAAVIAALEKASASFAHQGEGGIKTLVGEMGKNLSGGECQRIALARIFLRDPSIIILDEATSALDNHTEAYVTGMFDELSKVDGGRTMIVIAHRLSTVKNADQIVVLDGGSVVDVGTHEELLGRCGLYQQLTQDPSSLH